jgi:hypothetical protein
LVLGRASAAFANLRFPDFSLTNSIASLDFSCATGTLPLDSLTYSFSPGDSAAIPARDGLVTALRPENMGQRRSPASWCQVPAHAAEGEGRSTPGNGENACGK